MDLISRHAAIDALREIEFSHYMEFGEYIGEDTREVRLIRAEKAQDTIEQLPSAQPEQRWIPVTERLPENNTRVIVWMAWGGFSMLDYQYNNFYGLNSVNNIPSEAVTAWMPLPEPYKGKQE